MSIWLLLKVFADTCLYFSVIGSFPTLFVCRYSFLWPSLFSAVGVMLVVMLDNQKHSLRYLGILLPLTSMLLASTLIEYLILIPVFLYVLAIIVRAEFSLEYYSFLTFFRRSLIVWFCYFFTVLLLSEFEQIANPLTVKLSYDLPLRYGLMYILSSIILLRSLRLGDERKRTMDRKRLAITAAGTGAFALAVICIERLLHKYGTTALHLLYTLMKQILSLPVNIAMWFFNLLSSIESNHPEVSTTAETIITEEASTAPLPTGNSVPAAQDTVSVGFPWWLVAVILAILAVVLFLMYGLYCYRSVQVQMNENARRIPPKKKAKNTDRSNRWKVRRYYREFLKFEKHKGMKLHTDQTSLDILQNLPHSANQKASANLRNIYLSARYDENCEITQQQVENARIALKNIREGR